SPNGSARGCRAMRSALTGRPISCSCSGWPLAARPARAWPRRSACRLGPETLLRLIGQHAESGAESPRVLGVDDLSLRRGVNFATLLVNLEAHPPAALPESPTPAASRHVSAREQQRAEKRKARDASWEEVRRRHAEGTSITRIAAEMGMSRGTVRRSLAHPEPPRYPTVNRQPSDLSSPS